MMSYNQRLGENLRAQRQKVGVSLADVQLQTGGVFKGSVLGAYERGDRAMTVHRLSLLCSFYGVHPIAVLPPQP